LDYIEFVKSTSWLSLRVSRNPAHFVDVMFAVGENDNFRHWKITTCWWNALWCSLLGRFFIVDVILIAVRCCRGWQLARLGWVAVCLSADVRLQKPHSGMRWRQNVRWMKSDRRRAADAIRRWCKSSQVMSASRRATKSLWGRLTYHVVSTAAVDQLVAASESEVKVTQSNVKLSELRFYFAKKQADTARQAAKIYRRTASTPQEKPHIWHTVAEKDRNTSKYLY